MVVMEGDELRTTLAPVDSGQHAPYWHGNHATNSASSTRAPAAVGGLQMTDQNHTQYATWVVLCLHTLTDDMLLLPYMAKPNTYPADWATTSADQQTHTHTHTYIYIQGYSWAIYHGRVVYGVMSNAAVGQRQREINTRCRRGSRLLLTIGFRVNWLVDENERRQTSARTEVTRKKAAVKV